MSELVSFFLLIITSFFTLINPLGAMPLFLSVTMGWSPEDRKGVAKKATMFSFIILCFFSITGQLLFKFFNISVDSFKIVGGIIFFHMGFNMLNAKFKSDSSSFKEDREDVSITPLAIPMITGPGTITNAIVLMDEANTLFKKLILLGGIGLTLLVTYIILINSIRILKLIGETGNNVMMRLMGLIVMVIAVEFFFAGLLPFIGKL